MASTVTYLLDTNVIVRYLVGDNPGLYSKSELYFRRAEAGKIKVVVRTVVVAEVCFVLESFYKKDRYEIVEALEVFLSQKWIKVEDREILTNVWQLYELNLHFVDSYLLAVAKASKLSILTFDKKLKSAFVRK